MLELLLDQKFTVEDYEVKIIDKKGPPEVSHKETRWKVKFSGVTIASGFVKIQEAMDYIAKSGHLGLWNALWTRGFQVNWVQSMEAPKLQINVITHMEM